MAPRRESFAVKPSRALRSPSHTHCGKFPFSHVNYVPLFSTTNPYPLDFVSAPDHLNQILTLLRLDTYKNHGDLVVINHCTASIRNRALEG